ncbi:mechanosensitive ion channel family protein [Neolewinella agarilytica]|uniref:Small-conductance mechanosensitive channel n=1 Tax=Neolewinella agarilytica TaxID=478744 RepID=A0A1H9I5J8_9BACT|nr:mechanosensitive ion channel domain-containing protein [Neolewinella agarilytica]SEQ69854.1 Small-conductance mechanosensitive channel [Neolewinella agarilytica]
MNELSSLIESTPLFVQMAILFGVSLLLATLVVMIVFPILSATAKRTKSFTLEAFVKRTRSSVFWLLTFFLTLSFWANFLTDSEEDPVFYLTTFRQIVRTLLYIFLGVLLVKSTNVAADTIRFLYNADDKNNLRERKILTQLQYIQRIAAIIIFIVILAMILMQFDSMRTFGTGLITSAGVGGIIIGLAAQKSIANLLAGFQIAFTQPIRLDDALIVNGEYGWVEEITLTYVTMRLWDQRRQIVPLQYFIDNTFQNWTRTNSELTGTVLLYVDYTFPVDALREEVDRWLPLQDIWDERVKSVMVTENSDRAMTIRVLVSAKDAGTTFDLRCRTREHLIHWIQENYRNCLPQNRVAPNQAAMISAEVEENEE